MAPGQVEKQQFKNNINGYVGAVVIGPKGDDRGVAVAPGATVWLSEQEQVLTANAPRNAKDNPFVEQVFQFTDPVTGEAQELRVTPLTPISEARFVPADMRFVPGVDERTGDVVAVPDAQAPGEVDVSAPAALEPPPVPRAARVAVAAAQNGAGRPDDPATETFNEETGDFIAPDEQAQAVDPAIGEETGAATPPSGPPTPGAYTASEEVGTPVSSQPPPFTPPGE